MQDLQMLQDARRCQSSKVTINATWWLQLPDTTVRACENNTRDHCAHLVSSYREHFAHCILISFFFKNKHSLSFYVYTRRIQGCLLRFWPLGQNPAGGNNLYIHNLQYIYYNTITLIKSYLSSLQCSFLLWINCTKI